jgi:phosphoribosyl 1,2-cyclic phosphodiesterase
MKIKFWGTRGSIPVPGRDTIVYGGNTTCVEIQPNSGRKMVIDAGTGIRSLGEKLIAAEEQVDICLLITHIHWDHILGFPFFRPIYQPENRIAIDGFHSCMKGLRTPFENRMSDGFWPVRFEDLKADIHYLDTLSSGPLEYDGVIVESVPLQHPQGGFGYRFKEGGKTLVFITDNELTQDAWVGRRPEDYVRFCKDADILIHDAQYTPEELIERKGWGHSDYVSTVDLGVSAEVGRLVLFHHDPGRKDQDMDALKARCQGLAREKGSSVKIDAAREGDVLTL